MTISTDIQQRVAAIEAEANTVIFERREQIHHIIVALVAQLHVLLLGPGGTAKSFLMRFLTERIADAIYFEQQLDEHSDPGELFGGLDLKALQDTGVQQVVTTNMLPEATHAFVDEVMNANGVTKRSMQAAMNERLHHNGGRRNKIPLRTMVGASNVNNADTDPRLAPFFDRWHIRDSVAYLRQRDNVQAMVTGGIARLGAIGRGTATTIGEPAATVTVAELDQAYREALELGVPDEVFEMALDIRDELASAGIVVSDRRVVDGFTAVLANAWVRGHQQVQAADLDILASMWWSLQEHESEARRIILSHANPAERAAMELSDTLDELRSELARAQGEDEATARRVGVELQRNVLMLLREAAEAKADAAPTGADTHRLDDVMTRAETFKTDMERQLYGLDATQLVAASGRR